jgi:hypothetical protein
MWKRVWLWAGVGLVAYVVGVLGWVLTRTPGAISVALFGSAVIIVGLFGLVATAAFTVRILLAKYGAPTRTTDGPEADYHDPPDTH